MEDSKIIELFEQRDEAAIIEAERKYGQRCRAVAFGILKNREDTEEVVSDTWLRAWSAIPPASPKSPGAFFAKITRNLAVNRIERLSAQKRGGINALCDELEECIPSPGRTEETVDAALLTEMINKFLSAQKPPVRAVFLKRYWQMLSVSEIALESGFSESKVKALLMRTRCALKVYLEKEDFNV